MAQFRKWVPGGLACACLAGAASAQQAPPVSCSAAAAPGPVYASGIAEPLADIVLTCEAEGSAPVPPGASLRVALSVALNVGVTNAGSAEDGPDAADAVLVVNGNDCAAPSPRGSTFGSCGAPSGEVQDPQFGRLASVNTLEWSEVTLPFPGASAAAERTTVRIRGIRGNASQLRLAAGSGQPSPPVTAAVRLRSDSPVALRNASLRLAHPIPGMQVEVVAQESASACRGDFRGLASVRLVEGFADALRSGSGAAGGNEPTRVLLAVRDVPDGVAVSVPAALGCDQPAFDGSESDRRDALVLGLVSGHDEGGAGGSASRGSTASEPTVPVQLVSGSGRVVYEVQSDDPARQEDCHVPVRFDAESSRVSRAQARVSAGLAPLSSAHLPDRREPPTRFAEPAPADANGVSFGACGTTLLFPFVTNQAGFSTAVLITHGSRQALARDPAASAASCDLHYYGATPEGQQALLVQYSTVIGPGEQLVFTLSEGNPARNILGTEQFQGYVMAVCGYPDARGYAFISDGFGGIPDLAMGYLAPVIPLSPEGRRLVLGETGR